MIEERLDDLTANEREFIEIIRTAEDPEEAALIFADIIKKMIDQNSPTSKILNLMLKRYPTIEEFAEAMNKSGKETADLICGYTDPTLKDILLIAKVLNEEPETIAQIFNKSYSKMKLKHKRAARIESRANSGFTPLRTI